MLKSDEPFVNTYPGNDRPLPFVEILRYNHFIQLSLNSLGREKMGQHGILTDDLAYEVLSLVEEIPAGKVETYGQLARLIGREKNSRLVARILSNAERYGQFPCHRVVNHAGRLAPGWLEQRDLLLQEGVVMKDDSHVDLKQCLWSW